MITQENKKDPRGQEGFQGQEPARSGNTSGQGRSEGSDQQEQDNDPYDISSMDRQEGNMDHGATGGNFGREPEKA